MDRFWAMGVFLRVAECGSFSRAAESLGLSNGAVTTCVRNLERHLDVTLINRDTRRLRLTEEGESYVRQAREVLAAVDRLEEETRLQVGKLGGRVNVEATFSVAQDLLCPHLPEFARRHPDITVALNLTNQPHNMIERATDVALRVGDVEDADLVARPLRDARFVVCGAPALAATLPMHPRDLDPRRCVGILREERPLPDVWKLARDGETVEILPDASLHFNTAAGALGAARAGVGLACVLDLHANASIADGSVVPVYRDWQTPGKTLYAVTPKSRVASAKVRAFLEFLVETIGAERRPSSLRLVRVQPPAR